MSDIAPNSANNNPVAPSAPGISDPLTALLAIADPVRWRILQMLAPGNAMSGTEIAAALGKYPDTVSKHLRVMREAGIVACQPAADQRFLAYSIPAACRKEIGAIDYGFCVLRIVSAMPPVVKD